MNATTKDTQQRSPAQRLADRRFRFTFSDGSIDRMGDRINPAGWHLDAYRKNPVVLFGHDYTSLPIGRSPWQAIQGGALIGDIEFCPKGINPLADQVAELVGSGWLQTVSVGFRPVKHAASQERSGIDFHEQELLEVSVVPVPANQNAMLAAKSLPADRRALELWMAREAVVSRPVRVPPLAPHPVAPDPRHLLKGDAFVPPGN